MSWFGNVFDNDYRQRSDIDALKTAARARGKGARKRAKVVKNLEQRIEELEDQVGELGLICRGLLTYLREAELVVPEELEQVFRAIDAEDGVIDGQITPEAQRPKPPKPIIAPKARRKRR